ncbi:MAG: PAS domain S-box protein [Aggregatilineales bacterium]
MVEPVVTVDPDTRRQLNVLTTIIIAVLFVTTIVSTPYTLFTVTATSSSYVTAVGVFSICICYVLARFGVYLGASWGMFCIISILIFTLSVSDTNPENIYLLLYLVIPIILSGMLFSKTTMITMTTVFMLLMALLPLVFDHISLSNLLLGPLSLIGITAFLLIVIQFMFDLRRDLNITAKLTDEYSVLRQLATVMPSMLMLQQEGKITYINAAGMDLLQANQSDQIINHQLSEFMPRRVQFDANVLLVRSMVKDEHFSIKQPQQFVTVTGDLINIDVVMQPLILAGVSATQIFAEQGQSAIDNLDSLALMERFSYLSDDYTLVYRDDGQILHMNAPAERLTGITNKDVHQLYLKDIFPMLSADADVSVNGDSTIPRIMEWTALNGEKHLVEVRTQLTNSANIRLMVASAFANDAVLLRKSHAGIETLFGSSSIALVLMNRLKGRIFRFNENFCDLSGYTRDDLLGQSLSSLGLFDEDRLELISVQLDYKRDLNEQGFELKTRDGDIRKVMLSVENVMVNDSPSIILILHDVTAELLTMSILEERESRYRTVSELMSDYAFGWTVNNGELQLEWITGAFERITGYTVDEALHWNDWELLHPDDKLNYEQVISAIFKGNRETVDYRLLTKSGKLRWVRDYSRPIWDSERKHVIGIYGAVQDVTAQYDAENALHIHAIEQAIVAEIGQKALEKNTTYELLLEEALPLITQVIDIEYCVLLEVDKSGDYLIPRASFGWDARPSERISLRSENGSQFAHTFLLRESIVVEDMNRDMRFLPETLFHNTPVISSVTVVIHGQTDVLGVLGVFSTAPHKFSLDDVNFLQSIANTFSAYVEQQRIAESETKQRTLAEALRDTAAVLNSTLDLEDVIDRVLTHVAKVVPHDAASIMLVNAENIHIIKYQGFGKFAYTTNSQKSGLTEMNIADLPILEHMVATQQPIAISKVRGDPRWLYLQDETSWIESYVGAPIFFQGEFMGILNVDSSIPGHFTDEDAQRLMAFANQASIALHNARYAADLQQRVEERTAELNLEHRRLQAILDATADGIFYTEDMQILYVNQTFCQMMGYSPGELVGKSTNVLNGTTLNANTEDEWQEVRSLLLKGTVIRNEIKLHRKDGETFDAALTISMADEVKNRDDPITTVTLVRDISQQKALDKQRDRFISSASHELRSPITSINTRLYLMRHKPDEMERHIALLERVVERMNILVEDLLDRIRIEQGIIQLRRRNFVLQNLVEKIVEVMRDDASLQNLTLVAEYIDQPMRVFADPDRLYQVVTNLIGNAISYTPDGGSIYVHVGKQDDGNGQVYAVVQVSDTGVGIHSDDLPHIFDAFYRANKNVKGTGLGLNIARELIRMHDGDIRVESRIGEGSTFSILLPYTDDGIVIE